MARPKKHAHLYELTKRGAQAQLGDLLQEIRLLVDLFPHLRDSIDSDELPLKFILKRGRDRADARAKGAARTTRASLPGKVRS